MSGAFGQWQNDRGYELIGSNAARPFATMEIISQRARHPIHESGYNVPACAVRVVKKRPRNRDASRDAPPFVVLAEHYGDINRDKVIELSGTSMKHSPKRLRHASSRTLLRTSYRDRVPARSRKDKVVRQRQARVGRALLMQTAKISLTMGTASRSPSSSPGSIFRSSPQGPLWGKDAGYQRQIGSNKRWKQVARSPSTNAAAAAATTTTSGE